VTTRCARQRAATWRETAGQWPVDRTRPLVGRMVGGVIEAIRTFTAAAGGHRRRHDGLVSVSLAHLPGRRTDAWARMDPEHQEDILRLWTDVVRRACSQFVASARSFAFTVAGRTTARSPICPRPGVASEPRTPCLLLRRIMDAGVPPSASADADAGRTRSRPATPRRTPTRGQKSRRPPAPVASRISVAVQGPAQDQKPPLPVDRRQRVRRGAGSGAGTRKRPSRENGGSRVGGGAEGQDQEASPGRTAHAVRRRAAADQEASLRSERQPRGDPHCVEARAKGADGAGPRRSSSDTQLRPPAHCRPGT